jgi:murein DD-endopeptidase MepM/ murein hydrolase activator NlpD
MRWHHRLLLFGLFWLAAAAVGCRPGADWGQEAPLITRAPTAVSLRLAATATVVATYTPSPPPTATTTATATATATATPVPTLTPLPEPTATAVDRRCGEGVSRPTYQHNSLDTTLWPAPDPLLTRPHFWLASPLATTGLPRFSETFPYGYDGGGRFLLHNGLDILEPSGTPLLAVANGTVVVAQSDVDERFGWRCDWYGNLVVLELDQQWQGQPVYILYGHLLSILVEPGQWLRRGDLLAEVGASGATIGAHLHLEVRLGQNLASTTRNPYLWLAPLPETGVIAGRLLDEAGRPWQGVRVTAVSQATPDFAPHTWSYLVDASTPIQADDGWAENFVLANLPAGLYEVRTAVRGNLYTLLVEVQAGEISPITIVAEP